MNGMGWKEEELIEQFQRLGLVRGDNLMLHSSLKSFGYVEGGADTVINALLHTIGEDGTLMVPTLTGRREDSPVAPPVFDSYSSKCWTGVIPETVRTRKGAVRSLHPTHSVVAIGSLCELLTSHHEKSQSPCDQASPYYKNALFGGYILLAGVDQESNTSIHSCEELAGVPYHLQSEITECSITDDKGSKLTVRNRLHNWEKPATDFNKLEKLWKRQGLIRTGKVGNSQIRLIQAKEMFEVTIELLTRQPNYLLV